MNIPEEEMAVYRATHRRRLAEQKRKLTERRERAWQVAREGARLLKEEFGATRVLLFGSLLVPEWFHEHSDVDLAADGIDERQFLRAQGRLLDIDFAISVDLVEIPYAPPRLRATIEEEGIEL